MPRTPAHLADLEPCPHLPVVETPLAAASMRVFGKDERGPDFYEQALRCAQSLWLQGLPAQSLLLLNRALGADLRGDEAILESRPLPYAAVAWVMRNRREDQFIGNPRRHYQHLATRMVEPRRDQRSWRAWACWHLACRIFPGDPPDEVQIAREGIVEPTFEEILQHLEILGIPGEVEWWRASL